MEHVENTNKLKINRLSLEYIAYISCGKAQKLQFIIWLAMRSSHIKETLRPKAYKERLSKEKKILELLA